METTLPTHLNLLHFALAGQDFAIGVAGVDEIVPVLPLTRVFQTPPFVAGIMNLRGHIVAVLDLAHLMGLGKTLIGKQTRILVVRARERNAGLFVDRILGTHVFDARRVEPTPSATGPGDAYLTGIVQLGSSPIPLLDIEKILYTDALA
ncbi:MAG: chemotaxis protein CheW [Planctomycetes bacterium]|nr:chemotaxis protein CheW [Planctomycetota bacterium]